MKVTIKLRTVIIALIILTGLIFVFVWRSGHNHQLEVDNLSTALYEKGVEVESYQIKVGELEETVFEAEALIITKDSEILKIEGNNERLKELNIKNVNVIGRLEARIRVLIDSIPPSTTITIIKEPDGNYAKLPLDYSFKDYYANMHTTVNENGLADMDFSITNLDLNIVIGEKGQGLFKKDKPVSSITTDCPYIQIDENTIAVVQNNTSPWLLFGLGAGTTAGAIILLRLLLGN